MRPSIPIEETARLVSHYAWMEGSLFETLGSWVRSVPEPEVKIMLATQAPEHGWHAQLWLESLPGLARGQSDEGRDLARPRDETSRRFMEAVADPRPNRTVERLAAVYRVVLPRQFSVYSAHLTRCTDVADKPVARLLRVVLADVVSAWQAGEVALESLLSTDSDVRHAAARQADLEVLAPR